MIKEKFYSKIDTNFLIWNENEIARRLKTERGYTNERIEKCKSILLESMDCRYCAVRTAVTVIGNTVDFGYFKTDSVSLANNLCSVNECYIIAVTLGSTVDRLLKKLSVTSVADYYITDALASALAESAADRAEEIIKKDNSVVPRFSVGYGDFCIEKQDDILKMLDAYRLLGISLSKTYLMTPQKTITAVIGIRPNGN